jgi:hypothetical protein
MKNLLQALKEMDVEPEKDYVTAPEPQSDVDWNTIDQFEGGNQQQAYVPKSGKSGVTVATGFDVGQRQNLEGLSPEVQAKLQPFVGAKRGQAERLLSQRGGVQLSPEQAEEVAGFAQNETEQKMKDEWSKMSDVPFDSLTPAQKTVMASVMHQYGSFSRAPRFSQFAGKGQWDKVVGELRNFKDDYQTRRNKEAEYLQQSLNKLAKK